MAVITGTKSPARARSFPACGRLIVLESRNDRLPWDDASSIDNFSKFFAINFPSMPDTIDLVRKANYEVTTSPALPDGVHTYTGTDPLEIPFSFKLHAFDRDYCPQGVLTLLQVTSLLQALVLPFGPQDVPIMIGNSTTPEGTDASKGKTASTSRSIETSISGSAIYPPATCYLELIITETDLPGLACIGYVKDVAVKLSGPYMKGPGGAQLLPTNGDFGFTFVHHPGHGNAYHPDVTGVTQQQQAFAGFVQQRMYNTRGLAIQPNWLGFTTPPSSQ